MSKKTLKTPVIETGRNIDDIVKGLISTINDEDPKIKEEIHQSLCKIGSKEPLMVLSKSLAFMNGGSRSDKQHRICVMKVISEVIDKNDFKWTKEIGEAMIIMASQEMIAESSIDHVWQEASSKVLISMARIAPKKVATELLDYLPANTPPHYFVIKTLGDFAYNYPTSFLPHLKEILTRTLPILAMLKHDNLRWVFAAAIGRWAEAVIVATNDTENPTPIPISEFSAQMDTALKHIHKEWLLKMSSKIRLASAEGIGYMAHIIEKDHIEEQLDGLIASFLNLIGKELKEQQAVTIGLSNLIESVIRSTPDSLITHVDILLKTFQTYINSLNNASSPNSIKNREAYLRCYELLGRHYPDKVITWLIKQFDNSATNVKIATLSILRHLVNKLKKELSTYKELIVGGVKLVIKIDDNRARLELLKLICEMGKRGYLSKLGGTDLLAVVVDAASITDKQISSFDKKNKKDGNYPPNMTALHEIRDEADKILFGFSEANMSEKLDKVFWPFLFEFFNEGKHTAAFGILAKIAADVAKRKKEDEDFMIDFTAQVNLPKPHQILTRLLTMLHEPYARNQNGVNILRALYCLSPLFHEEVIEVWAKLLPEMKKYIDDETNFALEHWENMILQLVRASVVAVGDDEWSVKLGNAFIQSAPLYSGDEATKKMLLSIIGLVIQKTSLKEFVFNAITDLFFATDHTNEEERLGCARGLGQAASVHTDAVLNNLQTVMKSSIKTSGFFYTLKPTDITSGCKASALLAYGYIAMLIPINLIPSRMEVYIIQNITPTLKTEKYPEIKENGLKALNLVGQAVHPNRMPDYTLKSRDELITLILSLIGKSVKDSNIHALRKYGLEALATLIKLPPRLDSKLQATILEKTLFLYSVKVEGAGDVTEDVILENLNLMLFSILHIELKETNLNDLLLALEPFTKHKDVKQREKSMNSYVALLKEFAVGISEEPQESKEFTNCGRAIGELLPRVTEASGSVRRNAIDAIYLLLRIHYYLEKEGSDLPASIKKIGPLRAEIENASENELLDIAKKLSSILAEAIIPQHLSTLVNTLFTTLGDVDLTGANGTGLILNGLIRFRGKEMETNCNSYIKTILKNMETHSAREPVVSGLQYAVRALARHHTTLVIKNLISEPTPHSSELIKSIQILTTDEKLLISLLDHVLDVINNSQIYDEKQVPGPTDESGRQTFRTEYAPTALTLSATAALSEILEKDVGDFIMENHDYYSRILCAILLRIGTSNECTKNAPTKEAQKLLKNFFKCVDEEDITQKLETDNIWNDLVHSKMYPEVIKVITELVCQKHEKLIKNIFENTKNFISRGYLGHRVASTCILAVLLKNIKNDRDLTYATINGLLGRIGTDEHFKVKLPSIDGLSGIVVHPIDQMDKFVTPVVGALLANLEDKDENIILVSMKSMKEILEIAQDESVSPLLVNICVRLKPSFEKKNPVIRDTSIDLFGVIARFSEGAVGENLIQLIHSNLSTLILHMFDSDAKVVASCKSSIRKLVAVLGGKNIIELFNHKSFDEDGEIDGDDFPHSLAVAYIKDFPNRVSEFVSSLVVFFKSTWGNIIAQSSLTAGYILAECGEDLRSRTNLRHTCSSLISLLRNPNPKVRGSVSKILGLLYES